LTAIIDPRFAVLNNNSVKLDPDRVKLKKPHLFNTDTDKDNYINAVGLVYNSIPSHDLAYHLKQNHQIIGIAVSNRKVAEWAAARFQKLHRPHVWEEMQKHCGATSIKEYAQYMMDFSNLLQGYTSNIIQLERILAGTADIDLQSMGIKTPGDSFYQLWLEKQHNDI
jgi:hypothetical protein